MLNDPKNKEQLRLIVDALLGLKDKITASTDNDNIDKIIYEINELRDELISLQTEVYKKGTLLSALFEDIEGFIYTRDIGPDEGQLGRFSFVSPQIFELTGYSAEDLMGDFHKLENAIHPEDISIYLDHLARVLKGDKVIFECRIRHKDGSEYRWFQNKITPIIDGQGRVYEIFGSMHDISDRRQRNEELSSAFQELEIIDKINNATLKGSGAPEITAILFDALKNMIHLTASSYYEYDAEKEVLVFESQYTGSDSSANVNDSIAEDIGSVVPTLKKGSVIYDILHQNRFSISTDKEEIEHIIAHYSEKKESQTYIKKVMEALKIRTLGILPLRDEDHILGLMTFTSSQVLGKEEKISISRIIKQAAFSFSRIKALERKNKQRRFFENILNSIPVDIAVFDQSHRYTFINRKAIKDEKVRNWLIGKDDFDYCNERGLDVAIAEKRRKLFIEALKERAEKEWVEKYIQEDGSSRFVLRKHFPYYENEKLQYVIGYGVEITALKHTEIEREKLVKDLSNRINELMQFNSVVSHNLRAPVATLLGLSELLDMKLNEAEKYEVLENIKRSAQAMDMVVRDLNQVLSAKNPLNDKKDLFRLSELIEEIKETLDDQLSTIDASMQIKIDGDANEMRSVKIYVQNIMFNLLSNSIKFRQAGRQLTIKILARKEENSFIIMISDNGSGIDLGRYEKEIFGLYKKFHLNIKGEGLGLHISRLQARALGGDITAQSIPGKGSVFTLSIPV